MWFVTRKVSSLVATVSAFLKTGFVMEVPTAAIDLMKPTAHQFPSSTSRNATRKVNASVPMETVSQKPGGVTGTLIVLMAVTKVLTALN